MPLFSPRLTTSTQYESDEITKRLLLGICKKEREEKTASFPLTRVVHKGQTFHATFVGFLLERIARFFQLFTGRVHIIDAIVKDEIVLGQSVVERKKAKTERARPQKFTSL